MKIRVDGNMPMMKQEEVSKLGKVLIENIEKFPAINEKLKAMNITKEDLTFANNTALYSTAVAAFVEKAFRPTLVAAGVIKQINDFKMKGFDSLKIPRNKLLTASDLPDSGAVTYSSADYDSVTISIGWKYAAQKITYQLLQHSAVDIMADQLAEIGDALARKVDSDIIASIEANLTSGTNEATLGSGNYINYGALVDAISAMEDNYGKPAIILTNPATKARLLKDTDIKQALAFGTVPAGGSVLPTVQEIMGMKLLVSQQVPADTTYLIDKRLGYLINGTDVITYDGRINGSLAFEVIGTKAYGVGIARPEAVYAIKENQ